MHDVSLRSCPYCLGARLKFSQRSHDPKKGVGTRRLFNFLFLAAYADCDCFAAKSHSTTTQYHQLRRLAQCRKEKTECKGQVSSQLRLQNRSARKLKDLRRDAYNLFMRKSS